MILDRMKEFENKSFDTSVKENPPVLKVTTVAHTIDQMTNVMCQDSYAREIQAGYSIKEIEANKFCISNGLSYLKKQVTNFYYELTGVALLISENAKNVQGYRLSVKVHVFNKQKETIHEFFHVPKEVLESIEFLNRVPFAVTVESVTKSEFKQILYWYVNDLLTEYEGEVTYVTSSNGWLDFDGHMVYVDGEKAIGSTNTIIKSSAETIIRDNLKVGCTLEIFKDMRQVLREPGQMDVLLLYVLMSYSYTLFKCCRKTLKHTLFVVGPRGTRKTAIALCFSQLGEKETPRFNFLATESGIQSHLQDYKDSCLLLDDLAPSINMSKRVASEQKLEMILRLMGDGGNRVINTYFNNATQNLKYEACGGMIITGEYFYSAGVESSIARAVVVELDKDTVDLHKLSHYQENPQLLECFIARYLLYVSKHWKDLQGILIRTSTEIRSKYQHRFSNGRYADYIGQYMAQTDILLEFFKVVEQVPQYEIEGLRYEVENNLLRLFDSNDRKMKTRAPIYTLLMSILYLLEDGKCYQWGTLPPKEGVYMFETEDAFYIRQKDLVDIVKTYCVKTGEPFVKMTTQELGKILSQEDVCTVFYENNVKRLAKKYTQYGNQRYMELNKKVILDKVGITNEMKQSEER